MSNPAPSSVESLPVGTSVRVREVCDPNIHLATGHIVGQSGKEDIYGERVPEGMVRLEFHLVDPKAETGIRHREAFPVEDVVAVYC